MTPQDVATRLQSEIEFAEYPITFRLAKTISVGINKLPVRIPYNLFMDDRGLNFVSTHVNYTEAYYKEICLECRQIIKSRIASTMDSYLREGLPPHLWLCGIVRYEDLGVPADILRTETFYNLATAVGKLQTQSNLSALIDYVQDELSYHDVEQLLTYLNGMLGFYTYDYSYAVPKDWDKNLPNWLPAEKVITICDMLYREAKDIIDLSIYSSRYSSKYFEFHQTMIELDATPRSWVSINNNMPKSVANTFITAYGNKIAHVWALKNVFSDLMTDVSVSTSLFAEEEPPVTDNNAQYLQNI